MEHVNDSWDALKRDMEALEIIKGYPWKLWWREIKAFRKGKIQATNLTRDHNIRNRAVALKNANA